MTDPKIAEAPKPTVLHDPTVRERHGVRCLDRNEKSSQLDLTECGRFVRVGDEYSASLLSPEQARYIAGRLRRLARRIEQRQQGSGRGDKA